MEENEEFDSDFNSEDIPISEEFWNYMENYWHNNREFPESTETSLSKKADLIDGKVPSSQLPSYVDDILELDTFESLPSSGEKGKIYVITSNNTQFRWSGSEYIQLNSDEYFMTTNTYQDINGQKIFYTTGGNLFSNNKLWVSSSDGSFPGITFQRGGVNIAVLNYDGAFFNIGYEPSIPTYGGIKSNSFVKTDSDDSYLLLGGGGHKPASDFATQSSLVQNHALRTGSNATDTWVGNSYGAIYNPPYVGKSFNSDGGADLLDATYGTQCGFINNSSIALGNPDDQWFHRIKMLHNNPAGYYTELAVQMTGGNSMWYKRYENGNNFDWVQVWDKENLPDYRNYGLGRTDAVSALDLDNVYNTSILDINDSSINRPISYGSVWTHRKGGNEFTQMAVDVFDGRLYTRAFSNAYGSTGWNRLALYSEVSIKLNALENATGIGFDGGGVNDRPYLLHAGGGYQFLATQNWVNSNFATSTQLGNYLTNRGQYTNALVAKTDYPNAITEYTGDPTVTGFKTTWGTSLHIKGDGAWYNRLDFNTNGRLDWWQGINTTDMTHNGQIAIIADGVTNWTSLDFNPDTKVNKSGDTMTGGLTVRTQDSIGSNNLGTLPTNLKLFLSNGAQYGTVFWSEGSGQGFIQQQRADGSPIAYRLNLQPYDGQLFYGSNEVATVNQIPDLSDYATQSWVTLQISNKANALEQATGVGMTDEETPYMVHNVQGVIYLATKEYVNTTVNNRVNNRVISETNASALGFVGGTPNTPYVKHSDGTSINLATEKWSFNNLVTLSSDQNIDGRKRFANPIRLPGATNSDEAVNLGQTLELVENITNSKFLTRTTNDSNDYDLVEYGRPQITNIVCKGSGGYNLNINHFETGMTVKVSNTTDNIIYINFNGGATSAIVEKISWAEFHLDSDGDIIKTDAIQAKII